MKATKFSDAQKAFIFKQGGPPAASAAASQSATARRTASSDRTSLD